MPNNTLKICDKCKGTNIKTLIPKVKKIDKDIEVKIGCFNFCGIGIKMSVCILNDIPITAESENELIRKINEKLLK